ncbi:L-fuculokinase [Catalinimonas alkaloidigena]|uniref:FGGY-family carbohydrate kinase n=1 Tax=Catalinimonas alkaloidigena TaxID=1075417 RepID=UPI0024076512|nr:FGGY family carbohydrate kinase [Catalinimonas alkaloidigena]MDF9801150.1 L-fuculokinase [Catalinimonas alkaloidigena]
MSESVIAVYDIGKTNKKLILFDRQYQIIHEESRKFKEITDDDGYPAEDLTRVSQWVKKSFKDIKKRDDLDIQAVNVSAYGASLVHLDDKGFPATHLYNYMKPFPDDLADQFYSTYGGREEFSMQTASPVLGMLNSGLQLYWLKYKKPDLFANIKRTLHLPQFFAYLLHKKPFSEITSIGCHTGLWDFRNDRSHDWVYEEKLTSLFPPIVSTYSYKMLRSKLRTIKCGVGIHDSSAALVPYLQGFRDPFMLISTGTWNITLNPFNQDPLTKEELKKDCLNFMDFRGAPVKASRAFLGKEHEYQLQRIADHFQKDADYHHHIKLDKETLLGLLGSNHTEIRKFYPQTMQGTGPMPEYTGPENDLSLFKNFEEAYHQLMLDLVSIQINSLKLAKGETQPEKIFVSGGFCKNQLFLQLLASYNKDIAIYVADLAGASALGAALVMHRHWNRESNPDHLFDKFKLIPPVPLEQLHQYQLVAGN